MTATTRIVERASGFLADRFGRRSFLAGGAVAGSALVTNPLAYALQPVSAYRAICTCSGQNCDCGALCCDGYTEFCCTMTGANTCPPNTILGGWWKVDGTSFCGGPRYYMDCNAPCNGCGCGANGICSGACSGTPCGCAEGNCNNRKAGCTEFRYGQCNQQLACIGPIVCRVVTCVPPWALDATCTTTVRVDNNTAGHDRPCLHAVTGNLDSVTEATERSVRVRGWALDFDETTPVTIDVRVDNNLVATVLADQSRPDVGAAFPGWGDRRGFDLVVATPAGGPRNVCVTARNVGAGTTDAQLGCREAFSRTYGHLDTAVGGEGTISVSGWAILRRTTAPVDVALHVDGRHVATTRADKPRADIGAAFPDYGPNHGFATVLEGIDPGERRVCAYVIDTGSPLALLECRTAGVGGVAGFPDVSVNNAFADEIRWLVGAAITTGYADGTFRPSISVSRQAMAAFLQRFSALVGGPTGPGVGVTFSDVGPGDPFVDEISWLAGNGIAEGFDDGTFRPTAAVSRQAMAAFLQRFGALVGIGDPVGGAPAFSDVPAGHPFADEIAWLAGSGITTGYDDGTFRPGAAVSRQAMAAFLFRLSELVP